MIEVVRESWCQEAEQGLALACGDGLQYIADEIKNGLGQLWKITHDNLHVSWMATRLEGDELVVTNYQGEDLAKMAVGIVNMTRKAGCKTIRFHTKHKGLARLIKQQGINPELVESIYRIKV